MVSFFNINFEPCITDNILFNKIIRYSYHKYEYHLDRNRRIFDQYCLRLNY